MIDAMFAVRALAALLLTCAPAAAVEAARVNEPLGQPQQAGEACVRPPVAAGDLFVAAGVYEGDTLADVMFAPFRQPVTVVRVVVAPGDQPISLVLSSYGGTVWDFRGATERITRVHASDQIAEGQVGVRGIAADRVTIAEGKCTLRLELAARPQDHELLQRQIAARFGRRADRLVYQYETHELRLPEGDFAPQQRAPDIDTTSPAEHDLYRFNPGGFVTLDPASIVARREVRVPETFAAEAGLMQLQRAGAIRPPERKELEAWAEAAGRPYRSALSPQWRPQMRFDYLITREILLPAGLAGAHGKNFLLAPGVPAPRGHDGHECVAPLEGPLPIDDVRCSVPDSDVIRLLTALPAAETVEGCGLFPDLGQAAVLGVSVRGPSPSNRGQPGDGAAGPIDLRTRHPGPVVLVLDSEAAVRWRIGAGPDTRIVGVLLTGGQTGSVEGIAPEVPVVKVDAQTTRNEPQPMQRVCRAHRGLVAAAHRGGPRTMLLDRQVRALVGRPLEALLMEAMPSELFLR